MKIVFMGTPDIAAGCLQKLIDEKFGQMLHAEKLGFVHPITKEYMEFTAPRPDYFENILNELR